MGKIKIIFVAEELQTNGAMISLISLLKALPKDRYDISLFLFHHTGEMMKEIPNDIHLLKESLPYKIHRMPLKEAIKLSISKFRIDLSIFRIMTSFQRATKQNFKLWPFLPNIEGKYDVVCSYADGFVSPTIIKKVEAKKKVCWVHVPHSHYQQLPFVYKALKEADLRIPVSQDTGEDLDNILGVRLPQQVIHNITDKETCIEKAKEQVEYPRKEGIIRLVSVGRVSTPKNFEVIPSTAEILKSHNLKFEWYIIGDGDKLEILREETAKLGLDKEVFFVGKRSNPMPMINSADIFVNPSRWEAWGMTVSEALCLGKVVITSNIPVFSEQIDNGINGLMCSPTPENLATIIIEVLNNNEIKNSLETNASNYPFNKEGVITKFNEMIESLYLNQDEN